MSEENKDTSIAFDDFLKVDIRAGMILDAQPVPKSEKLLKLEVDFGELGKRQILAGIAKSFPHPMYVTMRVAAFVVNLAPRKMMGLESHGMVLAAATNEEGVTLLFLPHDVKPGTRIG